MLAKFSSVILAAQVICFAQTTYSYDSGGHLSKVSYGASGSIIYGYDAAGHLISRTPVTGTGRTISMVTTAFTPASSGIAQNTWVEIEGTNLVPANTPAAGVVWSTAPQFALGQMPTTIGGVSVTVNGKPAYVYFYCSAATSTVCPQDQINVLTPPDSTLGAVPVVVTSNGLATAAFGVTMHALVPALFNFDGTHVVATHLNFTLIGPTSLYPGASTPAAPGETIIVYGSGFGNPPGATITGGAATQSGQYSTAPTCTVGGTNAPVGFAGLVGPGLVQMNVTIPTTAPGQDDPITCTFGGVATPTGNVVTVQ
jgi:uncharacterized protein (TIGR03437 family)